MSEDIDITKLETPELLELIQDDLYDGLADEVVASVNELLAREMTPFDVLNKGLVAGMEIVGFDFRDGILFVPEVLMAAKAMKAGMEILRPLLVETGAPQVGTLVIGTVKGDIHDIGKNLVAMMMEGAGFNVINLTS
jgi:5-methyltetrahydrofolate--homocysteine methyltransferase